MCMCVWRESAVALDVVRVIRGSFIEDSCMSIAGRCSNEARRCCSLTRSIRRSVASSLVVWDSSTCSAASTPGRLLFRLRRLRGGGSSLPPSSSNASSYS
jgi:hypothetical protein